jgi:type III secretory pathway component EscT
MLAKVSEEYYNSIFRVENQPSKKSGCSRRLGCFHALPIFNQEDGRNKFLRNVDSHTVTWRYFPEDCRLHNLRYENHKSYTNTILLIGSYEGMVGIFYGILLAE